MLLFRLLASTQQDVLLTHPNNFPFSQAKAEKVSFPQLAWGGDFHPHLLASPALKIHIKNYSAIARRENNPFYPARTGINFSYFQLARRSFRFPSQLTSQFFFFPASSNSAWRAGILSSGSVGYSWNLDSQTKMLGDHPSQWIYHSRIMTVFHEFSRFTLCHTGQFTDPANPPPPLSVLIGKSFDFRFCYFKKQFKASLEQFYIFPGRSVCMWTLDYTFELNSLFQKSSELRPKNE